MEMIEVGAVAVDQETKQILGEFQSFIRPVRHPKLTRFCTELTSIQQADVDRAPDFQMVFTQFMHWFSEYEDPELASWGAYDVKQLYQDCDFHGIERPAFRVHRNLKQEFSDAFQTRKRFGMNRALQKLGIPLQGTHHRGIDDARNIAAIFLHLQQMPPKTSKDSPRT